MFSKDHYNAFSAANRHVEDLRVDVILLRTRYFAVNGVNVVFRYSNAGDDTLSICKWYLPENGLVDPIFEIIRNGECVNYVGPLVKRRAPTVDDLISLSPETTVRTVVQLSLVFNMTQSGNYLIQ